MERQLLLLGILRQQEMHGYQLLELIERDLVACTDIKKPTAYYLLNKMAEDGWVTEEQIQAGNRPPRRVFQITERGEAEFQRLLHENLTEYQPVYFPGDVGLAFLDSLEPAEALHLLGKRRVALTEALTTVKAAPQHKGSFQLVLDHQVAHLNAELAWLDHVIAYIQENKS